uniref:Uncharacterized protein n=1 Tax=Pseudomonas aeruginosa TaxID=287 RepID=B3G1F2_PSEAI|nr:hypothetical protein PACL_0606 [Pseudomonas aeruginosa]
MHLVPMESPVFSRVWYCPPPNDACARSHRDLIKSMDSTPGNHPVIADKVFRFAQATLANLISCYDYQSRQIERMRQRE